ncbi:MAG: hypothetical protein Q4C10_06085 [Clostridia bacterium]|nr:hypothetical protein [Clostridia bacterium]
MNQKLDFKALSRDPDAYEGEYYEFSGKVLQVLEEKVGDLTYTELRVATRSGYDDIVYVLYLRQKAENRILEDDNVKVSGQFKGLTSYESIFGETITLPMFMAESVTLR